MEGLEGKTALVTGGAGGIGSTIGEALLESGGRVSCTTCRPPTARRKRARFVKDLAMAAQSSSPEI